MTCTRSWKFCVPEVRTRGFDSNLSMTSFVGSDICATCFGLPAGQPFEAGGVGSLSAASSPSGSPRSAPTWPGCLAVGVLRDHAEADRVPDVDGAQRVVRRVLADDRRRSCRRSGRSGATVVVVGRVVRPVAAVAGERLAFLRRTGDDGGLTTWGLSLLAAMPAPAKSVNADTTTVAMPAPKTPPTSSNPFFFGVDFIARTPFVRTAIGFFDALRCRRKNGFPRTLTTRRTAG